MQSIGKHLERRCYVLTTLVMLISAAFPIRETHAQTASIPFTSSWFDFTGSSATGYASGSFSIPITSSSNIGLGNISSFQYNWSVAVPGFGAATFNYGLADLTSFSLNFGAVQPSQPSSVSSMLSFNTNAVGGSNPQQFAPESVSVDAGASSTYVAGYGYTGAGVVTLNQAALTQAINTNAVQVQPNGARISATFTPNFGLSLQQAATLEGFVGFNWVQTVMYLPSPSPFRAISNPTLPITAPPNFLDPVAGGYTYGGVDNSYPFYYDANNGELSSHETGGYTLTFRDTPGDPCLSGGSGLGCDGHTVASGASNIVFGTDLVGITADGQTVPLSYFDWKTNFNGTSGGVGRLSNDLGIDPGSGFGGVTLLSQGLVLNSPSPAAGTGLAGVLSLIVMLKGRRRT